MLSVLAHHYAIIDFKIELAVGGLFFLFHPCQPASVILHPHTFLIISVRDRLIRLSLNGFKCSRPISALL